MGAVIDESAYTTQADAIDMVKKSDDAEIVVGGDADDSDGYFVGPTVVATTDPSFDLMQRELFGPVVTAYVYDEKRFDDTLDVVNATSPYALTGAVFATDRSAISQAHDALRDAAGNFYVNDKPTGAVVGQQPFGGARASGTNDKAGSMWNLIRWTSPRTIKETFVPADRLPLSVHGRGVAWRGRPHERWHRCRGAPAYRRPRRRGSSCCATPSSWTACCCGLICRGCRWAESSN